MTVIVAEDGSHTVLYDTLPEGIRNVTVQIPDGRHSAFITDAESDMKEEYSIPSLHEYNGLFYTFIHDTTQMLNIACIGNGGAYWETGEIILEPNGEDVGLDLSDIEPGRCGKTVCPFAWKQSFDRFHSAASCRLYR